jgi:hypothetical protein
MASKHGNNNKEMTLKCDFHVNLKFICKKMFKKRDFFFFYLFYFILLLLPLAALSAHRLICDFTLVL